MLRKTTVSLCQIFELSVVNFLNEKKDFASGKFFISSLMLKMAILNSWSKVFNDDLFEFWICSINEDDQCLHEKIIKKYLSCFTAVPKFIVVETILKDCNIPSFSFINKINVEIPSDKANILQI